MGGFSFDFGGGGNSDYGVPTVGGGSSNSGINVNVPIGVSGSNANPSSNTNKTGTGTGTDNNNNLLYSLLLMSLLGAAGGFPSTSSTKGTSESTTDTNSKNISDFVSNFTNQQQGTTGVMPTLSPETYQFMNQLMGRYQGMTAPSLTGYEAQQTGILNNQAGIQQQSVNNILAARGLSTSPVAATAQANIEQNRLNQIATMKQSLPLLQNQLNLQNLAGASAFFSAIPKGTLTTTNQTSTGQTSGNQTSTGTSTSNTKGSTTSNTESGGGLGGALTGVGAGLAYLLPYLLKDVKLPNGVTIPGTTNTTTKTPTTTGTTTAPGTIPGNQLIGDELGVGPPNVTPPAKQSVL